MLKIKLARFGKRKQPVYRIVVNEAKTKRDGKYVELLGHYIPTLNPKVLKLDVQKYDEWISKGAQPTDTVASLAEKFKSGKPFVTKKKKTKKTNNKSGKDKLDSQSQKKSSEDSKETKQTTDSKAVQEKKDKESKQKVTKDKSKDSQKADKKN